MRRIIVLGFLFAAMQFVLPYGSGGVGTRALLTFGFLILAAYTVGELAKAIHLPKIVGYMGAGLVFGPYVAGTLSQEVVLQLGPVSSLAIALIAFLAGAELQWGEVKSRGSVIVKILSMELLFSFIGIFTVLYLLHDLVPFLREAPNREVIAFAVLFASVAIVHSPAVTLALVSETGARGTVARTTLGIVLVADVAVVLLFSGALAFARGLVPPSGGGPIVGPSVLWEIGGAVLVGAALGAVISIYLRFVKRELFIFAIVIAFFGAELSNLLHVETLLTLLVAGFVTENAGRGRGEALRHAMERAAAPIFVVFFALAGAKIDPSGVVALAALVVPIAIVRIAGISLGSNLGARWARTGPVERRYVWMGLVSQAGVAIGLAAVVAEVYPSRGEELRSLFLALIAINETVGAVLFRQALARSGELRSDAEEQPARGAGAPVPAPSGASP